MAESNFSIPSANPSFFVTLCKLTADGIWEDSKVGVCVYESLVQDENGGEVGEIQVVSAEDYSTKIWTTKILEQTEYNRPQDTLILWTETDNSYMCLRFEKADDCEIIWRKIQGDHDSDATTIPPSDSDINEILSSGDDNEAPALLPRPEVSNLSQILQTLSGAISFEQKDRFASFILRTKYIDGLIALFDTFEHQKDYKNLRELYRIMMAIIMLENDVIIEYIVRDDIYMGVIGMLEFNPLTPTTRTKHREILAKIAATEPIVPFNDEYTLGLIHKTYRIRYVRSTVVRDFYYRSFDSMLKNMISSNDMEIVNNVLRNKDLLNALCGIIKSRDSTDNKKIGASQFILQICSNCNEFPADHRAHVYSDLYPYGFLDMFAFALSAEPKDLRLKACDVLCLVTASDPSYMRLKLVEHMKEHGVRDSLMAKIVDRFTLASDWDLKLQLFEVMRFLLDFKNRSNMQAKSKDEDAKGRQEASEKFIYSFFDDFATSTFLQPFDAIVKSDMKLNEPFETLELTVDEGNAYQYHCELLCLLVEQHSSESTVLFTQCDVITKVVQLYRCRRLSVKHAALRFIRACVGVPDIFYHMILIKENAFEPTMRVLLDTDGRDNLLNSACLELFEFIRRENVHCLVNHLITQYGSILDTLTYVSTFSNLRLRYEQNQQTPGLRGMSPSSDDATEESNLINSSIESHTAASFGPGSEAALDDGNDNDDGGGGEDGLPTDHVLELQEDRAPKRKRDDEEEDENGDDGGGDDGPSTADVLKLQEDRTKKQKRDENEEDKDDNDGSREDDPSTANILELQEDSVRKRKRDEEEEDENGDDGGGKEGPSTADVLKLQEDRTKKQKRDENEEDKDDNDGGREDGPSPANILELQEGRARKRKRKRDEEEDEHGDDGGGEDEPSTADVLKLQEDRTKKQKRDDNEEDEGDNDGGREDGPSTANIPELYEDRAQKRKRDEEDDENDNDDAEAPASKSMKH